MTEHRCREVSIDPIPGWDRHHAGSMWLCPCYAEPVVLPTPAGRPPAVGGPYCPAHGGDQRSRAEAERDWNYAAPASVGDAEAVHEAGPRSLYSVHACVVVRPERKRAPDGPLIAVRWLAWLGIGGCLDPVPNPHAHVRHRSRGRSSGRYAFPSREAALEIALLAWRKRLDRDVAAIREARGGTLDWGMPIEPRDRPHIYMLDEHGSAWDAEPIKETTHGIT